MRTPPPCNAEDCQYDSSLWVTRYVFSIGLFANVVPLLHKRFARRLLMMSWQGFLVMEG